MIKYYAYFDSTQASPQRVFGWYNTGFNKILPDQNNLLEITAYQWDNRLTAANWAIDNSQLVIWSKPTPEPPTTQQQAMAALFNGVTINYLNHPEIDGLYSCDATAQQKITSTMVYVSMNNKFPGSSGILTWYDMTGNTHIFSNTTIFTSFASAIADYVTDLIEISLGGSSTLPSPIINIQ
jgi:hypothetical protein